MLLQSDDRPQLSGWLLGPRLNPAAAAIFAKAWTGLLLFRLLIDWPLTRMVMEHHRIALPHSLPGSVLMAPSFLANEHVDLFLIISALGLIVVLLMRPNYLGNLFVFWIAFNSYTVDLPFGDGADLVVLVVAFWCIPLATVPALPGVGGQLVQRTAFNTVRFIIQWQVVLIYFVSGLDKLLSATWRSGEAFDYMRHLDALYNPLFPDFLQQGYWDVVFSWATLTFELLFVLVWVRRLKWFVLLGGVLLHLGIWIVLSLPDFALVMIVSYLAFVDDHDYEEILRRIRRRPR